MEFEIGLNKIVISCGVILCDGHYGIFSGVYLAHQAISFISAFIIYPLTDLFGHIFN